MAYEIKKYDEFKLGDKNVFTKTITETDVIMFAGISGDFNPVHMNEVYAKTTMFQGRIVHGMFIASLLGQAGASFFGGGAIYIGHTQKFTAPVRIGDTISAIVEVTEMIPEKKIIKYRAYCQNQEGKIVVDGEATIKIITQ
ncbi:MaoC family dehydratase [Youngiibacter multivorans]|uniref:3-hydroxybutyryl-CoA dehydratase n=1 Tax=Youngiibacter multivorans TaxID=937251 RepID=A0ABS4G8G1_9CLOT|nr:MaoC family dehydratase [Youngiibacter multivorans]MBP1920836.1 3-hydroxybutyryl-CoA dehydratase [Youngiibacter multivorans]